MAVLLEEPTADECAEVLASERGVISAATVAEALIVAKRRGLGPEMIGLIDGLGLEVVNVTAATARRVADAYAEWGKGGHSAALNFGDCFAYDLAKSRDCPLLYVGMDFGRTDIVGAINSARRPPTQSLHRGV